MNNLSNRENNSIIRFYEYEFDFHFVHITRVVVVQVGAQYEMVLILVKLLHPALGFLHSRA
jgi:preprotein translocase subunit Sec61beta